MLKKIENNIDDVKKSANSYKRKNFERPEDHNNIVDNSAFEEENTFNITRRIELYKHQIERKIEHVISYIK